VNTPRCDEDMLELRELMVFLLPSDEKVGVEVSAIDLQVSDVRLILLLDALHLDDAEGIECLPNKENFIELARMGNLDSPTIFYMYPRFLQLMIRKQVGDLSTYTIKYTSLALTHKVFANMRRVGVPAADIVAEGDVSVVNDEVPTAVEEPSIPSPTPPTLPPQPSQDMPSTSQDKIAQALEITKLKQKVKKLEKRNKLKILKLRRLKMVGSAQRIDTSDDTVMDDVSKQRGMIANIDADEDVVLEINLEYANKVLSMQDEEESEPAKLQEVVDVVTTPKIITDVVTAASKTITAVDVLILAATTAAALTLTATPSRRAKVVVIRDSEESTTPSTIIHSEAKSNDKGKGILVEEPKPLKKQAQIKQDEKYARELEAELNKTIDWDEVNDHVQRKQKEDKPVKIYQALKRKPQTEAQARKNMMIYLKNVAGFKMDYFKGMSYDDISLIFEKHFDSNVDFLQKTKEQMDEENNRALKRLNESQKEKAAKKQKLDEKVEELKRHLQIVPNDEDDVYTEATPLACKVPIVDYEIYNQNNKPYYKSKELTIQVPKGVTIRGFEDPDYPHKVYKVVKALYGLHQAPRAWYETLANYLLENGFQKGKIDQTLFIKKQKGDILLVQVYVDDIIFSSTNKELCKAFEKLMKDKFQMSSIGELTFFLGLQVKKKNNGIFISQDKYVAEILRKFGLTDGKSASTPIDIEKPLLKDPDGEDVDVHIYRSMIGSLMYLTSSRPNVMFAVCACARFQVTPKVSHLHAVKKIFRYLKGKPHLGLWNPKDSPFNLVAYSDSDYAGASLDRKSTTGGWQFLGYRLISWQCKKQTVIAASSTKAEYVVAASCCAQVLWIQNQLLDYGNEALAILGQTATGKENLNPFMADSLPKTILLTIHGICINMSPFEFSLVYLVYQVDKKDGIEVTAVRLIINDLQALIDRKNVIITKDTIRQALRLDNVDGIDCLPNEEIFAELARMGYEKPGVPGMNLVLSWLQLSSAMPQYTSPALTQKVFANMRRIGKGFSRVDTLLFDDYKAQAKGQKVREEERIQIFKIKEIKEERKIVELDADEDVTLEEVDAEVAMDADVQGRLAESQANVYHLDLEHAKKVLSMQDTDKAEPAKVEEASAPRRRKGVVIQDPKETATASVIVHSKMTYNEIRPIYEKHYILNQVFLERVEEEVTGQKEEGSKRKDDSLEQRASKKQRIDEETEELKTHLQIVANDDDDMYTKATPLTLKMILLVEKRYHLTRFTLEQMLNNVRLEVEEESEMSLELLRNRYALSLNTFCKPIRVFRGL
nr:uncharacterized mitochondrial protein AtMg00810-like [Tanacetum cinerariifolium]